MSGICRSWLAVGPAGIGCGLPDGHAGDHARDVGGAYSAVDQLFPLRGTTTGRITWSAPVGVDEKARAEHEARTGAKEES